MIKAGIEHNNQGTLSKYPFADNSTMECLSGSRIAPYLFTDACLYICGDYLKLPYISSIKNGIINISIDESIVAFGNILDASDDGVINIISNDILKRNCGSVSIADPDGILMTLDASFDESALLFSSSCVFYLKPIGITSLSFFSTDNLDVPYLVVAGAKSVSFRIRYSDNVTNSVFSKPNISDFENTGYELCNNNFIEFGIHTFISLPDSNTVREIEFEFDNSIFIGASLQSCGINLTLPFSQEIICENTPGDLLKNPNIIDEFDACDPEDTPDSDVSFPRGASYSIFVRPDSHGSAFIAAPFAYGFKNPIHVNPVLGSFSEHIDTKTDTTSVDANTTSNKRLIERAGRGVSISIPSLR